jgi:hypothetical protein
MTFKRKLQIQILNNTDTLATIIHYSWFILQSVLGPNVVSFVFKSSILLKIGIKIHMIIVVAVVVVGVVVVVVVVVAVVVV